MRPEDYKKLDGYLGEIRDILYSHVVAHKMRTKPLTKDWRRAVKYLDKVNHFVNRMLYREHPELVDEGLFEYVPPPPIDAEARRQWEIIFQEGE